VSGHSEGRPLQDAKLPSENTSQLVSAPQIGHGSAADTRIHSASQFFVGTIRVSAARYVADAVPEATLEFCGFSRRKRAQLAREVMLSVTLVAYCP
jgi:hypothetical protein